jgi:hypothetical protein
VAALTLNRGSLTVGDMEDFEEVLEEDLIEFVDGLDSGKTKMKAKHLKVLIWIIKRKETPGFTLEQARDVEISELLVDRREPDPTQAAPKTSGAKSKSKSSPRKSNARKTVSKR